MKNIFTIEVSNEIIDRINNLTPTAKPTWGKMNVAQMLAHCNVSYAQAYYPENFKKPNFFQKLILKNLVKSHVVNTKPFNKNGRTAPDFIITDTRNFENEKSILIENIKKTQQLGAAYFEQRENFSFGKLTASEWNNMLYKHLDHHLNQFDV
ncbi:MAG: DUF1569 domain-containing protein [Flavobacterium sp.]|nr:DUF1569 domain-containing protein [Flavobacterium sp.]